MPGQRVQPDSDWFRTVAQMSGDLFWTIRIEPDLAFEFITDNVVDRYGYTAEEFRADPALLLRMVHVHDLPVLQQALDDRSGETRNVRIRWAHRSGATVTTAHWYRSRQRDDGSWVLEGSSRDVTAQWRTEVALQESEQRFRNAMHNSAIAMCLVSPAGQFQTVNKALCDLLGRDEATLRSTTWQNLTHPGDLNADVSLVDDVLAGRIDSYRLLKRYLRPDRSVVWGDMSVACVRDENGRVQYLVTQIVDMTTQMQTEQALRASEEQYRLLVEESSDFLVRTKGDPGVITWVSESVTRVLGWHAKDLLGTPSSKYVHPQDLQRVTQGRQRIHAGERVQGRLRMLCADGSYRWLAFVGRALTPGELEPGARISSFQDIDAQVRAEQALDESRAAAQADRERLRATMDAMLDPHFVVTPVRDHDGRIVDFEHVDVNDAGLGHARMTREEFLGTRLGRVTLASRILIDMLAQAFDSDSPLIEDALPLPVSYDPTAVRMYDLRGVRVGDTLSVTVRDVTERAEAAEALAESKARYRMLAENASDVVYRIAIDGTIEWLSDGVKGILGGDPAQYVGRHVDELVYGPDQEIMDAATEEAVAGERTTIRLRVVDTEGHPHWLEATLHTVAGDTGPVYVGGCRDIDAEMAAMAELDRRARTDHLTGLLNRDEALDRLRHLLAADQPEPVAVAFCDLDEFKRVNDTFGHAAGDEWLQQAAARIRSLVREGDLVARVGGDEILVALPGTHSLDQAVTVCETLRAAVREAEGRSTVSIGVTLGQPGEDVDTVIARADRAMYVAKNSGRNRVVAQA